MAKTQTLEEHLTAMRDDLKNAAQKQDADAKTRINSALEHAQMARTELKTRTDTADARVKAQSGEAMQHLDELTKDGKKALEENGEALRARVDTMIASAKSAVESVKK